MSSGQPRNAAAPPASGAEPPAAAAAARLPAPAAAVPGAPVAPPRLALVGVCGYYGRAQALFDASLEVAAGEVVALVGRNGAGKSTLLKAAMGLVQATGAVRLDGQALAAEPPHRRARAGLGYVPEDRRIFTELTVRENLAVGARGGVVDLPALGALFPNLVAMLERRGDQMSGGEQQMLAVARTLAGAPRAVLLDEPSEGIAPLIVERLAEAVLAMKARGLAVLLAEQNLQFTARVADRAVLLEQGHVVGSVPRTALQPPSAEVRAVLGL